MAAIYQGVDEKTLGMLKLFLDAWRNIWRYILLFFNINMVKVLKILSHGRQGLVYHVHSFRNLKGQGISGLVINKIIPECLKKIQHH